MNKVPPLLWFVQLSSFFFFLFGGRGQPDFTTNEKLQKIHVNDSRRDDDDYCPLISYFILFFLVIFTLIYHNRAMRLNSVDFGLSTSSSSLVPVMLPNDTKLSLNQRAGGRGDTNTPRDQH